MNRTCNQKELIVSENPLTNKDEQQNKPKPDNASQKTNPVAAGFSGMRDVWAATRHIKAEENMKLTMKSILTAATSFEIGRAHV